MNKLTNLSILGVLLATVNDLSQKLIKKNRKGPMRWAHLTVVLRDDYCCAEEQTPETWSIGICECYYSDFYSHTLFLG